MKKLREIQFGMLVLVMLCGCLLLATDVQAAKKAKKKSAKTKVTCKLKKGTLTISGKGAMPKSKSLKFKKKKVKKVVIKKGITSVSDYAFQNCKKLKTVKLPSTVKKIGIYSFSGTAIRQITVPSSVRIIKQYAFGDCKKLKRVVIPGDFKFKPIGGDEGSYYLSYNAKLESLCFNSKLSLANVTRFDTQNLYTWEKDTKYKSMKGVIYSRDGKSIVRVPNLRESLTLEDGCEEFCLQSVLYTNIDNETDPQGGCELLKKIVIPASVKRVDDKKYYSVMMDEEREEFSVEIQSKQLDSHAVMVLLNHLPGVTEKNLAAQLPGRIISSGDMKSIDGKVLYRYTGKAKAVTVPDGINEIGDKAFAWNKIVESVTLPESVTVIGQDAFYYCEALQSINLPKKLRKLGASCFVYCGKLKKILLSESIQSYGDYTFMGSGLEQIKLPSTMTSVPPYMFQDCSGLTSITIPDSVKEIGDSAFYYCSNLKEITLGKGVKKIQEAAFGATKWTALTIPATVKKIGGYAFGTEGSAPKKVTVLGSAKNIAPDAFGYPNVTVTYKKSPKEAQTYLHLSDWTKKKGNKTEYKFEWNKVAGVKGYQFKYSPDKKFKKKVKTLTLKKNKTSIKVNYKGKARTIYAKIRPFTIKKGKKVYGRWVEA